MVATIRVDNTDKLSPILTIGELTIHCRPFKKLGAHKHKLRVIVLNDDIACTSNEGKCYINGIEFDYELFIALHAIICPVIIRPLRSISVPIYESTFDGLTITSPERELYTQYKHYYDIFHTFDAEIICEIDVLYCKVRLNYGEYHLLISGYNPFEGETIHCTYNDKASKIVRCGKYYLLKTRGYPPEELNWPLGVAFVVLNTLFKNQVNTTISLKQDELRIGDHYSPITNVASAAEFVKSLCESRVMM